jgi:hypothetical protein
MNVKFRHHPTTKKSFFIVLENEQDIQVDFGETRNFRKGDLIPMNYEDFNYILRNQLFKQHLVITVALAMWHDEPSSPRFRHNIMAYLEENQENKEIINIIHNLNCVK